MAVRCKCMANQDREWNEAIFSGRGAQTKYYEASGCCGGDILLKIGNLTVEGIIRVSQW